MAYNDILRLRFYQTLHGSQMVNVMHFVSQDVAGVDQPIDLANDFVTNMATTLRARCVSQTTLNYVEVQKIVPFAGGPAIVNFPGGSIGTDTGVAISATLCEVMTIYSERGGRRGRGRVYWGGADQSANAPSAGIWNPTQTAKTQALANALAARYITATPTPRWYLGVWSRAAGPLQPPWTTSQFARATALSVRTIIRTQRRRQVGVGR